MTAIREPNVKVIIFSPNFLTNITTAMNININVDDIDKLNTRNFHELTTRVDIL